MEGCRQHCDESSVSTEPKELFDLVIVQYSRKTPLHRERLEVSQRVISVKNRKKQIKIGISV
jgi:hypothetical protein